MRTSRFKGILQPRQTGVPRGDAPVLVLYDIEENRIRSRVSELCLDFGLERIQYSAFSGRLTRSRREELALRLLRVVQHENVRIRMVPLTDECLEQAWEYDWWRKDAEQLAAGADTSAAGTFPRPSENSPAGFPRLKRIRIPRGDA